MVDESSPLARPDAWDAVAPSYASELLPVFTCFARDALESMGPASSARVLDVATGPGTLALLAAPKVRQVVAADFSPAMLDELRERAREQGADNIEVRLADGQALPFADDSFEGAASLFGLMFFPDRAAGLREMARVSKPGARCVVSSWAPLGSMPLIAETVKVMRDLLPALPFGEGAAPLSEASDVQDEMSAAGLVEVSVRPIVHDFEIASTRAFWETQTRSFAPIVMLRKNMEAASWRTFSDSLLARLESSFGTSAVTARWCALLATGVVPGRGE